MVLRSLIHALLAIVLLPWYGIKVCPFLESLAPWQLALPILVALGGQQLLRQLLFARLVLIADVKARVRHALWLELVSYVVAGGLTAWFNTVVYQFPGASGAKLLLGFVTLGFFAALDVALACERAVAREMAATGQELVPDQHFFPLSARMALFATLVLLYTAAILHLVILKDLEWLVGEGERFSRTQASLAILKEVLFVSLVMIGQVVNLIFSYSRNLHMFFYNENTVLAHAAAGRLDQRVPVGSNDEFGVMARHTNQMIASLEEHLRMIQVTQDVTIHALASLAETRDNETGAHILRTQRYVLALARHLRTLPRYAETLDEEMMELIYKSAPLHDVGKVGIPDRILLKPGKHSEDEFAVMKTHAQLGEEALARAEGQLGPTSFLRFAREIAGGHHEKWDGSGYPRGLTGEGIPLSARLMAVADVYDALISKRVYKPAFTHEQARAIIVTGRGSHFDPVMVDAFLAVEEEIQAIAREFADASHDESYQLRGTNPSSLAS